MNWHAVRNRTICLDTSHSCLVLIIHAILNKYWFMDTPRETRRVDKIGKIVILPRKPIYDWHPTFHADIRWYRQSNAPNYPIMIPHDLGLRSYITWHVISVELNRVLSELR
jgi:hypothetical protein